MEAGRVEGTVNTNCLPTGKEAADDDIARLGMTEVVVAVLGEVKLAAE